MNLNQLTVIGFVGRNAETRQLPNNSLITKFSVATTKSWKDDNGEWKNKTQWHTVCGFGQGCAQMTPRLLKGTLVFVQGELSTREYDRAIRLPSGKKSIEHVIQQIAVELKADTIRVLDRAGNPDQNDAAEPAAEEENPPRGGLRRASTVLAHSSWLVRVSLPPRIIAPTRATFIGEPPFHAAHSPRSAKPHGICATTCGTNSLSTQACAPTAH